MIGQTLSYYRIVEKIGTPYRGGIGNHRTIEPDKGGGFAMTVAVT